MWLLDLSLTLLLMFGDSLEADYHEGILTWMVSMMLKKQRFIVKWLESLTKILVAHGVKLWRVGMNTYSTTTLVRRRIMMLSLMQHSHCCT